VRLRGFRGRGGEGEKNFATSVKGPGRESGVWLKNCREVHLVVRDVGGEEQSKGTWGDELG